MEYNKLSRKAIGCMYTATTIGCIILAVIFLGGYFGLKNNIPVEYTNWLNIGLFVLMLLLVLDLAISPLIRYRRYRYLINDEKIEVITGLLFITREIVPIERLHKITVEKGPIDRVFGLGKVLVTTAGGDVTIRFLEEEKAEQIAEHLRKKINEIIRNEREEEHGE